MIDKLFFLVLVLNATGLFAFLAPQFDVEIGYISLVLLMFHAFYTVARWRYLIPLLRQADVIYWLFVLLLWPLLTIGYAPSFEIRDVGLQLYFFTLFFGAVVYTAANGLPAMHRVLYVSLIITVIGLVLSLTMPQYFEEVSEFANAKVKNEARAFGFLLQPNSLAIAMGFLFIGWFALWRHKNTLLEVVAIFVFFLLMLLTGSRTGILVAVIVVMFILAPSLKKSLTNRRFLLKTGILIVCLAVAIIGTKYYLSQVEYADAGTEDLIKRMEMILSFRLSDDGGIKNDGSVRVRLAAQEVYWSLFKEKPFLGHGFGSDTYYKERGPIFLSSHSDALTYAMEYGALYPVAFGLLMLQLYRRRSHLNANGVFQTNSTGQFVCVTFFLFMISGGLIGSRTFLVVWGMFFAAVYYPRCVTYSKTSADWLSGWLGQNETVSARPGRIRRIHGLQVQPAIQHLSREVASR